MTNGDESFWDIDRHAAACAARHAVIIPSVRRPLILADTVRSVLRQEPLPKEIVVVIAEDADVDESVRNESRVRVLLGRRGGASQRNDGMAALAPEVEYITFLDDDVELATNYMAKARAFLDAHPDVVLMNGTLLQDGHIDRAQAIALVGRDAATAVMEGQMADKGAYGNNFTVRRAVACSTQFDERFRLYSWLEDLDFGARCGKHGKVVKYEGCKAVHLAAASGRVSGVRMGFSQLMNPFFIRRKGLMGRGEMVRKFWFPALRNNTIKLLMRDREIDRWGRLRGNLIALWRIARGHCEPEYVETLR